MKSFKVPEVDFVYFTPNDIVTVSDCEPCDECTEGGDSCPCYDTFSSDSNNNGLQGVMFLD